MPEHSSGAFAAHGPGKSPVSGGGPETRGGRLLVAYGSRFGTTGDVAQAIADTVRQHGTAVDTLDLGDAADMFPVDVADIGDYDAVVVGAPIHYDNWMAQARDFVADNEAALSTMPVAYFFTCGTLFEPTAKNRAKAQTYADKLRNLSERVTPVEIGQFGGVLDYSRMNLRTRLASRLVFTVMGVTEGDYRDWDAIRSWNPNLAYQG